MPFPGQKLISVMPELWGPGGPLAPPIFGRSVNPISTGESRLSPPNTTGTPNVFHLLASLNFSKKWNVYFRNILITYDYFQENWNVIFFANGLQLLQKCFKIGNLL